ncbi:MAG: ABC transporter ATP-binding protein/permease [Clostridiales bacterium]|nr:ABC transporter ATP-binding protein/permease [Clostridiales bacterium]
MESYLEEQDFSESKVDLRVWARLYRYALRHTGLLISIVAAILLVATLDVCYPLLTGYAVDHFITPRSTEGLPMFCVVYLLFIAAQGILVYLFIARCGKMEMRIAFDVRRDAFEKLQNQSFAYYDGTAVGYLMARMVADIATLSELVSWSFVDVVWGLAYACLCVTMLLSMHWKLALITVTVLVPLSIASHFLRKVILKHQREAKKQNSKVTGALAEGIMGAMTSKILVREERNREEFMAQTDKLRHSYTRSRLWNAVFFPLVLSLGAIGTSLALCFGTEGVVRTDYFITGMSLGNLITFITYAANLFEPIQQLSNVSAEMQEAQASAERVLVLLAAEISVTDSAEVAEKYGDTMHPKRENWELLLGDITFEDVSFSYKTGEPILEHFNLHIPQGQTVALVGETGAGKSTLVNLICRFYEPTGGRILIDGMDYKERSQLWLQSHLGYVLQTPHLFSGTIRDNIRFGKPEADQESVLYAAKLANAHPFIEKLEKGYDTEVGEGGILLSTGQKQLISLARVICADPRIFILDEATSSVDAEAEALITDAIANVLEGRSSVVVAHRLSTIRNADCIYVLEDGKILESGSHAELLDKRGAYHGLYMRQFMEEAMQQEIGKT